jgi:hypothetical protein
LRTTRLRRRAFAAPPQQSARRSCAFTRAALRQRERLGQVVVGAELEAEHAVELGRLGGEHQDRRAPALRAQRLADLEAVEPGIIRSSTSRSLARSFSLASAAGRRRPPRLVAGAAQVHHQQLADVGLVFGDEDGGGHADCLVAAPRPYSDVIFP